jgi:phage portal protein BeeE
MRLPWQKKTMPALGYKMASWMMGMNALRQMQVGYQSYASEGYSTNPIVRACVDKIAGSISSVDLTLYKREKGGKVSKVDRPA